jgi:glycosyltransferase involved in cell wall biosynthesis
MNKSSHPLVTVIIPLYNTDDYVCFAINSVINQTYSNWELIIIDDGSTDSSLQIAKETINGDKRARLISHPNEGVSSTRNTGINYAEGEFIAFLDADDIWMPTKLERQIDFLQNSTDILACTTHIEIINENGEISIPWSILNLTYYLETISLSDLTQFNCVVGSSSGVLAHKSVIDKVGYFDQGFRHAEDWDYWFRLAQFSNIIVLPFIGVQIRNHTKGVHNNREDSLIGKIQFVEKNMNYAPKNTLQNLVQMDIMSHRQLARIYFDRKDFKSSFTTLVKIILKHPVQALLNFMSFLISK